MRVHDSLPLHERSARELAIAELLNESMVEVGRLHFHIGLLGVLVREGDVEVLLDIVGELGKSLSAEHISVSLDLDVLLIHNLETRVSISPTLIVEVVDLDLAMGVVVDDLRVGMAINCHFLGRHKDALALELLVDCRKSLHLKILMILFLISEPQFYQHSKLK